MWAGLVADYLLNMVVRDKRPVWAPGEPFAATQVGFDAYNPVMYEIMARDHKRTNAYAAAIAEVCPGKIVCEIGTGALAVLARLAAKAGAKRVYAIEGNRISADRATKLVKSLELDHIITIIHGVSTKVTLPERADVLLHEIIGPMGSDEGMVPVVADAKQRLLVANPRCIPQETRTFVAPVSKPTVTNPLTMRIALKLFWNWAPAPDKSYYYNFPRSALLAGEEEFEHWPFERDFSLAERKRLTFTVHSAGSFEGWLLWIAIQLTPSISIDCFEGTHWGPTFIPTGGAPVGVDKGDRLVLDLLNDQTALPVYELETKLERQGATVSVGNVRLA